jgi:hypothetical protein
MPFDDRVPKGPAHVLLLPGEDDLDQVVFPRLRAADARVSRVHILSGIRQGEEEQPLWLPDHLDVIEREIRRKNIRLVIFDPLSQFVAQGYSLIVEQSVRRLLGPVATLARETGAAFLLTNHLSKRSGGPALYRASGSIGIMAMARSVLLVAPDPDDQDALVLASTKSNLGPAPVALSYRVKEVSGVPRLEWLEEVGLTPDELLSGLDGRKGRSGNSARSKVEEAELFLTQILGKGPISAEAVKSKSEDLFSWKTVLRAKQALGVRSKKQRGVGGQWDWELAEGPAETDSGEVEEKD